MKKKLLISGLALAILFGIECRDRAEARTTIGFNVFFDALSSYGDWVSVQDYGHVWYPRGVGRSWRPYSNGRWLWSDHGWFWSSYEPWGWATYHYGRWVFDNYYGWIWVPGTLWAPAWVTWYTSPDYIGWAPLPPDDDFFSGRGIGFDYDNNDDYYYHHHHNHDHYIDPSYCVFVPSHHFIDHHIHSVAVAPSHNITIIKNTKNATKIKLVNNRIINYGPDIRVVEKRAGAKVRKINVVETDLTVSRGGANVNKLRGDNYYVFRPQVLKKGDETPLLKGNAKKGQLRIESKKDLFGPNYEKTIRSNQAFIDQDSFEQSSDREHSIRLKNTKKNSFVSENTNQPQITDTYSDGRYLVYKNLKKKSLSQDSGLIQPKKGNKGSYFSPRVNKDLDHRNDINAGKERTYQGGSTPNLRKNGKSDLYKYQNNGEAFNYKSKLRKEPKNLSNPNRRF